MEQEVANANSAILIVLIVLVVLIGSGMAFIFRYLRKRKRSPVIIVTDQPAPTPPVAPSGATATVSQSSGALQGVRDAFFLGGVSATSLIKWVLRIVATIVVIAAILGVILSKYYGYEIPLHWLPELSPAHWFIIIGLLVLAALFIPKGSGKTTAAVALALTVLILAGSAFAPFINWAAGYVDRTINLGDWSDPSDYVQRVDGGTLRVPAGSIVTVDISGQVRIPIPVQHCLDIAPKGKFRISWDDAISNAFITPMSGRMERVTVQALPPERCGNET